MTSCPPMSSPRPPPTPSRPPLSLWPHPMPRQPQGMAGQSYSKFLSSNEFNSSNPFFLPELWSKSTYFPSILHSTFERLSAHAPPRQSPSYTRYKRRLPLAANQKRVFRSRDLAGPISVSEMVTVSDGEDIMEAGLSQTGPRTYQQLIKQTRSAQKQNNVGGGFWEPFLQKEGK